MHKSSSVEKLIEVVSAMKDMVGQMLDIYNRIPDMLDSEISNLKKASPKTLEAAVRKKLEIEQDLKSRSKRLGKQMESGMKILGEDKFEKSLRSLSLEDFLDATVRYLETEAKSEFAGQVLQHLVAKTREQLEQFRYKTTVVGPCLEKNQRVIERFLKFYQENFRFWQEVITTADSTYTAKGTQKHQVSSSGSFLTSA